MWNSDRLKWSVLWSEKSGERWPDYNERTFLNKREARGFAKFLSMKPTTLSITITSIEKWWKENDF